MEDLGKKYEVTVEYTMPQGGHFWAQLTNICSSDRQELWTLPESSTGLRQSHTFHLEKTLLSGWDRFELVFDAEDSYYFVSVELPLRVLITGAAPVGNAQPMGCSIENELKTGVYEIHSITSQPLSNGYTRYCVDMTLAPGMTSSIFIRKRSGNQRVLYPTDLQSLTFDLAPGDLEDAQYVYLIVGISDNDRFFLNITNNMAVSSQNFNGVPVSLPVTMVEQGADGLKNVRCTAQSLTDGSYRYTLTCQVALWYAGTRSPARIIENLSLCYGFAG